MLSKEQEVKMKLIELNNYLYFNLLSKQTIQKLFYYYGNISINSFRIEIGGKGEYYFNYPNHLADNEAKQLINRVCESIKYLTLDQIQNLKKVSN